MAPTRNWVTCSSKPGVGGTFSFFGLSVSCYLSLRFSSKVRYKLGKSKAVAHVAADLQCWYVHCKAWKE